MINASECREAAKDYKAQAKDAGLPPKKLTLLKSIAQSLNGLASQLEMLDSHEKEHRVRR
jgi:hypothetical protein